jgi:tryptophan-rich sensory protein
MFMEKPQSVNQAIYLIWFVLAVSVFITLLDKWSGSSSEGEFMFTLILYGIYCIIPYKVNNRSNATRYVYGVLVALSLLTLLGGATGNVSALTNIASILLLPVQIFTVYRLFQPESNEWFTSSANISTHS